MTLSLNAQSFMEDMKLLVTYPAHVYQPIRDIAQIVYYSFFEYGLDVDFKAVSSAQDLNVIAMNGTYSHILSINSHDYLKKGETFYLDKPKLTKLMTYNLEQTPIRSQNSYWASMRLSEIGYMGPYFDYIVSESECKNHVLQQMGLPTLLMNLPYHPVLDLGTTPSLKDKQYDVFFIGCGSERRENLVKDLVKEGVTIAPAPLPQALMGSYKADMVKKSKICLNVHFSDMEYFEKPRLMYDYFMNRGTVVSEKILYNEDFEHTKDFYMAKYVNLVPMVMLLLNKYDESMIQMGQHSYETLTTKYHYSTVIPAFIEQLYNEEMKYKRARK